ncbi:carbonic anhydrase-related protein 10 isoform X1 [Glossina fuscipes]|uniref:Carbonic anhydrase-related protein 10 isoform X1 n=1 Tax=Glossina fuscipes TaxID=7396 RepID=A0A9C6DJ12_9MUSC|nr:carbonic anhydrase-related protein 10 isoform X1 [Glossina fuscipes]XP_037887200.1 carbonic anhydrase-related protein 10 isoform X1 [Glossina fuscipes]XP_037887210.1 carbonic anhydrase-related protein 10 isoform X1 [Glossina fuscipes]
MDVAQILCFCILMLLASIHVVSAVSWEEWWTYDGISGPAFWGLINPEWSLCNKGRRQSPVNLEPQRLLFDPNLRQLHIDKHRISGLIANTGHSVIFTAGNDTVANYDGMQTPVNITGGPFSYRYRFHEIHIHYGLHDQFGSEHSVDGYTFPAEIQIFGYNSQLYNNFSDALNRAQGIVGVSILLQLGDLSNAELRMLTDQLERIRYGGDEAFVKRLSIRGLLPDTDHYMTYDGSTTAPACHETVTWVVLNKPIYITKQQLYALRRLMQGSPDHPKAPLGNNYRPPQPLLHRPIRTNIDFKTPKINGKSACPTMYREVYYKATSWKQH